MANKENQVTAAWLSYYYLIKQDVERLDYRLFKMSQEATTLGADEKACHDYIAEMLPGLILLVAQQRDEREARKKREVFS